MSNIERIECTPFRIPLRSAVGFATGSLTHAEHVLVRVHDADGGVGVAEAIPRPMIHGETIGSVLTAIETEIAPRAIGTEIAARERRAMAISNLVGNHTAKAAVEMACFDLFAQRLGVSCWRLLGGYQRHLDLAAILGHGTPDAVLAEAQEVAAEHGLRAFKVKTGVDVAHDIEVCTALRTGLGDDAFLWVDANHGYDVFDALRFDRAVADLGLAWTEEPTPADRPRERMRVVQEGTLTVLGDESCSTAGEVVRELEAGRCAAVSLKVGRSAYLEGDRIRGLCEALGIPLLAGSQGESDVGTLSCLAYACAHPSMVRYPSELSYFLKLEGSLLADRPTVVDGRVEVPDVPGAGIVIDESALEHFRTDPG